MTRPLTETQFRALVEQFVKEQGSQKAAARAIGIRETYLSRFLLGYASPGPTLAAYFGLTATVMYVRLGEKP